VHDNVALGCTLLSSLCWQLSGTVRFQKKNYQIVLVDESIMWNSICCLSILWGTVRLHKILSDFLGEWIHHVMLPLLLTGPVTCFADKLLLDSDGFWMSNWNERWWWKSQRDTRKLIPAYFEKLSLSTIQRARELEEGEMKTQNHLGTAHRWTEHFCPTCASIPLELNALHKPGHEAGSFSLWITHLQCNGS
jgi:hypothetical protein